MNRPDSQTKAASGTRWGNPLSEVTFEQLRRSLQRLQLVMGEYVHRRTSTQQ
jgi:hypothetical protein